MNYSQLKAHLEAMSDEQLLQDVTLVTFEGSTCLELAETANGRVILIVEVDEMGGEDGE